MPEHIGAASNMDPQPHRSLRSFDGFLGILNSIFEKNSRRFSNISSNEEFCSWIEGEGLIIQGTGTDSDRKEIEREDLYGVWTLLDRGILTRSSVGWAAGDRADELLSVLRLLPGIKPLQIQRRQSDVPEIALEVVIDVGNPVNQIELKRPTGDLSASGQGNFSWS